MEHTYQAVGANERGLVFTGKTIMLWTEAAKVAGRLVVKSKYKESLLDTMRRVYVQANGSRPHIATVGKAIAAL
jgi:hypothetical protein